MTRAARVGEVLESLVMWQRRLASLPAPPFASAGLSRAQVDVLFVLTHGMDSATPGAIATRMGISRGAVSQLLESLVAAELVQVGPHPDDARSRLVTLTPQARAVVTDFESQAAERMEEHFDALTDSELATLATLLQRTVREDA